MPAARPPGMRPAAVRTAAVRTARRQPRRLTVINALRPVSDQREPERHQSANHVASATSQGQPRRWGPGVAATEFVNGPRAKPAAVTRIQGRLEA